MGSCPGAIRRSRRGRGAGHAARGGAQPDRPQLPPHGRLRHRPPRRGHPRRGAEPAERGAGRRRAADLGPARRPTRGSVFVGGPVEQKTALCLAALRTGRGADGVKGLVGVRGPVALVDLDGDPEPLVPKFRGLRVFAGYAGWDVGQLAGEIERGDWIVVPALPDDVLAPADQDLWGRVLRRQGMPLALLATYPGDVRHQLSPSRRLAMPRAAAALAAPAARGQLGRGLRQRLGGPVPDHARRDGDRDHADQPDDRDDHQQPGRGQPASAAADDRRPRRPRRSAARRPCCRRRKASRRRAASPACARRPNRLRAQPSSQPSNPSDAEPRPDDQRHERQRRSTPTSVSAQPTAPTRVGRAHVAAVSVDARCEAVLARARLPW